MAKAPSTASRETTRETKAPKASKAPVAKKAFLAHGIGRRKSSVARVWLSRGNGKITVNDRDFTKYFDTEISRLLASAPLSITDAKVDVMVNLVGGGHTGQAGAMSVGIARALVAMDESVKPVLRQHGLLTVDSRLKERKKYGQKAARRKFQFVKR